MLINSVVPSDMYPKITGETVAGSSSQLFVPPSQPLCLSLSHPLSLSVCLSPPFPLFYLDRSSPFSLVLCPCLSMYAQRHCIMKSLRKISGGTGKRNAMAANPGLCTPVRDKNMKQHHEQWFQVQNLKYISRPASETSLFVQFYICLVRTDRWICARAHGMQIVCNNVRTHTKIGFIAPSCACIRGLYSDVHWTWDRDYGSAHTATVFAWLLESQCLGSTPRCSTASH